MAIKIEKVNRIENKLKYVLEMNSKEQQDFIKLIKDFIESKTKNKIEGIIEKIDITSYSMGDIDINIVSLKEDKLSFIEDKR